MPQLDLTPLQTITYYSFMLSFIGMSAASLFFFIERSSVIRDYRPAMTISGAILAIAAINYFYMKNIYLAGVAADEPTFPTAFRYIDWILTVPLMLVKFPVLLGLGPRGKHFLVILVTLAVLMIVTGLAGELNPETALLHYGSFGVGCVAWLLIVGLLFFAISDLPEEVDPVTARTIRRMTYFVLLGWSIYPIGYLAPAFGFAPDYREIVYNIGDLINKIGLALFVYEAALGKERWQEEQQEVDLEYAMEQA